MARSLNLRNLEIIKKQLLDKKNRSSSKGERTESYDAQRRISDISDALDAHSELYELRRHTIVAVVAALQTYHRGYLADVMDNDPTSQIRGAGLVGEKIALNETLKIIGGDEVSLSDVIAHSAPINSVDDMITWLSAVFENDFKKLLSLAVSPFDRDHPDSSPKIVEDVDALLRSISEAFRLRHILAHEAAPTIDVEFQTAREMIDAVQLWIRALDGVLWQTVLRTEPLTQFEINEFAYSDVARAEKRLDCAIDRARTLLSADEMIKLEEHQQNWLTNVYDFIDISYGSNDGTMWPAVRASILSREINARSEQIEEWIYYLEL